MFSSQIHSTRKGNARFNSIFCGFHNNIIDDFGSYLTTKESITFWYLNRHAFIELQKQYVFIQKERILRIYIENDSERNSFKFYFFLILTRMVDYYENDTKMAVVCNNNNDNYSIGDIIGFDKFCLFFYFQHKKVQKSGLGISLHNFCFVLQILYGWLLVLHCFVFVVLLNKYDKIMIFNV